MKKGNSRFLFREVHLEDYSINDIITEIDTYIESSLLVEKAFSEIIMEITSEGKIRIGREIIGFDQNLFAEVQYKDYLAYEYSVQEIKPLVDLGNALRANSTNIGCRIVLSDNLSQGRVEFKHDA